MSYREQFAELNMRCIYSQQLGDTATPASLPCRLTGYEATGDSELYYSSTSTNHTLLYYTPVVSITHPLAADQRTTVLSLSASACSNTSITTSISSGTP